MRLNEQQPAGATAPSSEGNRKALLGEWVAPLRQRGALLRQVWARRVRESHVLPAMSDAETNAEATSLYDNYLEVLETGSVEALQGYARALSERIIPHNVETHEVLDIVLLFRDVLGRSLLEKYHDDFERLRRLRAGHYSHRRHGGRQLCGPARARHPPATKGHARVVHAGVAGAGAAVDSAHHRGH